MLDLVWCQLVVANGKRIAPSDLFIVKDDRAKFETAFKGVRKRIPGEARSAISALQPYKGGNDLLWVLHELDVIDKHRLLLAVWASNEAVVLTFRMPPFPGEDEGILAPPIGIRPAERRVEDRTVLYRIPAAQIGEQIHEEPEFRMDIALDEPPIVECEPVVPLLAQLRGAVNDVIELFSPILTK